MLINNKYKILEKIGSGTFGSICKGENIRTGEKVAIKIESIISNTKMLKNETIIYNYLKSAEGVPKIKWFGKDSEYYYMVINLLGESLETIKTQNGTFSLKLCLQIGIQVISLLQTIHNYGLVHRDIKPDNFLLGINDNCKKLYIIDFGLCKVFVKDDKHIEMKKTTGMIGSMTYASISAHKFCEQSRRDDLESLGYMLLYFFIGKLEWQNIGSCKTFEEKNAIFISMKENIIYNKNAPAVLVDYIKYVRQLSFDETPDYLTLIESFKREIAK
jgi:serine/threonine protein kinase